MTQYDVTLRDFWRILRKRKIIVVFATVMLGLTSFATALVSKPELRYRATAKAQYEKAMSAQEAYIAALGESDDLETQQAVITSYPVVERVAHRLGHVDTASASGEERIQAILRLRPMIVTEVEGLTSIISISVAHGDPRTARDIANAVAEEYVEYNFESRNAQLLKSRMFVKSQRDTVEHRLTATQERLKLFQEETQVVSIHAQTSAVLGELSEEQSELEQLDTVSRSIGRILKTHQGSTGVSERTLASILPEEGGVLFNELSRHLQTLNQERNRLLIAFTEEHPQVRGLDSRKQIIIDNMLASLRVQQAVLSRRLESKRSYVRDLTGKYKRLPQLGIQLDKLTREVRVQANLLEFFERAYQEARIAQSGEVHEVTILQKALLPRRPINPTTPTTTAGTGAVLGLILGVVFAFIVETLDTSIGTIEDVEEYIEVPVVGIIPQIDVEGMREALIRSGIAEDDTETMERRLRLASHFEPRSTIAESYRALRTNIQFADLEKGAKVISVTSATNQEGKSTTAANLATTLAQAGNRVLLVDCDLRRPTVNRIFGIDREPGITDVILGNYAWREVVRTVTDIMAGDLGMEDIMITPGMDNLNIITSGVLPPNPAKITDSRRMSEFIEEVKEVYDVILFDSPPVIQATEATVLGTKVDGVLLVYKIGQVARNTLRRAKLQLDNVNVTTLGVVINGLRAEVSEDFQNLRYYYYYSYDTDAREDTGPLLQRFYHRALRKLQIVWGPVTSFLQPVLGWLPGEFGKEETDAPGHPEEEYEKDGDETKGFHGSILHILLWIFLILFLTAGILWQLGLIKIPPRAALPTSSVEPAPGPVRPEGRSKATPAPKDAPAPPAKTGGVWPGRSEPESESTARSARSVSQLQPAPASARPGPAPPAVQTAALSSTKRVAERSLAIHVGSHKIRASAERDAQIYRKRGYSVRLVRVDIPGRGLFYRVLVEGFSSRRESSRKAAAFKSAGITGYAAVVPLPSTEPKSYPSIVRAPNRLKHTPSAIGPPVASANLLPAQRP